MFSIFSSKSGCCLLEFYPSRHCRVNFFLAEIKTLRSSDVVKLQMTISLDAHAIHGIASAMPLITGNVAGVFRAVLPYISQDRNFPAGFVAL